MAGEAPAEFGFKGEKLGMSFDDFSSQHKELSHEEKKYVCEGGKCGYKKVTVSDLSCQDYSPNISGCNIYTSIAQIKALEQVFFVEKKLFAIGVDFSAGPEYIDFIRQGLTMKLGTSDFSVRGGGGAVAYMWESQSSMAELENPYCERIVSLSDPSRTVMENVGAMFNKTYCGPGASINSGQKYLLMANKPLFLRAIERMNDKISQDKKSAISDM